MWYASSVHLKQPSSASSFIPCAFLSSDTWAVFVRVTPPVSSAVYAVSFVYVQGNSEKFAVQVLMRDSSSARLSNKHWALQTPHSFHMYLMHDRFLLHISSSQHLGLKNGVAKTCNRYTISRNDTRTKFGVLQSASTSEWLYKSIGECGILLKIYRETFDCLGNLYAIYSNLVVW